MATATVRLVSCSVSCDYLDWVRWSGELVSVLRRWGPPSATPPSTTPRLAAEVCEQDRQHLYALCRSKTEGGGKGRREGEGGGGRRKGKEGGREEEGRERRKGEEGEEGGGRGRRGRREEGGREEEGREEEGRKEEGREEESTYHQLRPVSGQH